MLIVFALTCDAATTLCALHYLTSFLYTWSSVALGFTRKATMPWKGRPHQLHVTLAEQAPAEFPPSKGRQIVFDTHTHANMSHVTSSTEGTMRLDECRPHTLRGDSQCIYCEPQHVAHAEQGRILPGSRSFPPSGSIWYGWICLVPTLEWIMLCFTVDSRDW